MPKLKKSISIQDQSTRLPLRRILVIYVGIGIALMVSFIDQTSVSTAAPVIGTALDGSDSISWVGTAFFVAKWVFWFSKDMPLSLSTPISRPAVRFDRRTDLLTC
jgi:hypothetical protein